MKSLIQGMSELSLIHPTEPNRTTCDVTAILQDLEPLFVNGITPNVTIEKGIILPLKVNETHITSLLRNLIENAIKYNLGNPHIKITSKKFKPGIVYAIKDNGIGIPKADQKKLFFLGSRLHPMMDRNGTGIGLYACAKIMSIYNGKIWVHSIPGAGSIFYLFFPNEKKKKTVVRPK